MKRLSSFSVYDIAISRTSDKVVYAAGDYSSPSWGPAFFRSIDGGGTWAVKALGGGGLATTLALTPGDEAVLYLAGYKRDYSAGPLAADGVPCSYTDRPILYKSTTGGQSWTAIAGAITAGTVNAVAVDPKAPARVFAGSDGGIYKSEAAGLNWVRILSAHITSLMFVPAAPKVVYAGGEQGIYLSLDGGKTWTESVQGMTVKAVRCLAADARGASIYAGTYGGGILKIRR